MKHSFGMSTDYKAYTSSLMVCSVFPSLFPLSPKEHLLLLWQVTENLCCFSRNHICVKLNII